MDNLEQMNLFASTVYVIQKPEFLETVTKVSDRYLEKAEPSTLTMSGDYSNDPEVAEFARYVSQTAWNILSSQGYDMDQLVTVFREMWTQRYFTYASMDQHIHGSGSQISAFYFLSTPEGSNQLIVYDPRPAKVIINLPEKDPKRISLATPHVFLKPQAGMLILTNSWMPHSFTRNSAQEPMSFVHMNLTVMQTESNVEVV
jgi:uncharacterized protein (TIGR02466 family)